MKMDNKIKVFLDELKLQLAELPEAEAKGALDYYEEYLNDALDEGKSAEDLLSYLDAPGKIASMIKAETSIKKAQRNPGLKNYSRVLKYARDGITKPFSILLFSLFIFTTYSMAIVLFLGTVASAAAACVLMSGFMFEALRIPPKYSAEIIGAIGSGLFATSICLSLAYGFYKLCRLLIMLSSGLVGRMLNKSRKPIPEIDGNPVENKKTSGLFLKLCITAALAGLVLAFASGLPVKLFMIFNSMEPSSIASKAWEYDTASVKNINIVTAHSHIRLEKGNSDKIKIAYTQPDWLEAEINSTNGQLKFTEKSNGSLPLFSLVSTHENRTEVTITLPDDFSPDSLKLESRGGFVHIDSMDFNVLAKTYTGNIYLESATGDKPAGIKASTSTGIIQAGGAKVGINTANGFEYHMPVQNANSIDMETSRGSIFIR